MIFLLIWPSKCPVLIMSFQNIMKPCSGIAFSLLSVVIFFSFLETKKVLKKPNKTFLKITRYISSCKLILIERSHFCILRPPWFSRPYALWSLTEFINMNSRAKVITPIRKWLQKKIATHFISIFFSRFFFWSDLKAFFSFPLS